MEAQCGTWLGQPDPWCYVESTDVCTNKLESTAVPGAHWLRCVEEGSEGMQILGFL